MLRTLPFRLGWGKVQDSSNDGDDIWLYDPNTTLVDYVAYGVDNEINQPPPATIWNNSVQNTLVNASFSQSISLTENGLDGDDSNCWETNNKHRVLR